ncbi:xanthine dehydrogenase [Pandoraea thiooxydans]|uniref:FAD-binding molybdopterin dehydrogenase n=1 Tax=Pandoraea thiooxydans TaxID=445709 RepID=A0A0G3EP60_9BURK|nr:xanthine dehydrogenase small subunit [Pandoraea thiooxydans]AKJ68770.1 xanthine dehydrogenase small subunit [Pandoraea thiooxydans]APR96227.1 xanthine dehydrogenase [Pandoraea thiooxydans]
METQTIRFYFRGQVHEVTGQPTTRTVLQHIREDLHCTGTKEGCAEGDCGACTVVIGELDQRGEVELRAVNACIQFLPTLDGKALYTVEDLRQPDGALHPVQQAMVDCHGSQCGFCTPGFIMSMWGMYLNRDPALPKPTREEINDVLSGNLCRCTGYRPIVDAAQAMFDLPRAEFDRQALATILKGLARQDALTYQAGNQVFHAPRTLAQLAELRASHPEARILAGSTDVGLWVTKQFRELQHLIYIGQVAELRELTRDDGHLYIGAGVLLNDAFDALVEHYGELAEMRQRFASFPIRNAGTLGGNVANGSPIGDSMPGLIALGTRIVLRRGERVRDMPLEDFYLAYQKNALEPGEFVQGIRVPLPAAAQRFRTYKLSKRFDQDISAVCAAFAITLDGDTVRSARIAFGGMAATPKRAAAAEQALAGKPWNEANARLAMAALAQDYAPLADMRASSTYRLSAAQNLLYRFFLETRPDAPLAAHQVNAFATAATV